MTDAIRHILHHMSCTEVLLLEILQGNGGPVGFEYYAKWAECQYCEERMGSLVKVKNRSEDANGYESTGVSSGISK
ncbi:hypothetical protein EYF80_009968 [Liparis tanakae]|uniref:Uncharacterized protein n=1 Tax=Liparis tanakae TaxID=230148 RepID=A0A4Z2IQ23_9TELE|nr:hypothetical protein EYF80_009968 [Liparis tanakae]